MSRLFVFDDGTGSALYAGGSFAGGVLRWNGASWSAVGAGFGASGAGSSNVADFEVFDDGSGAQLYAGGFMQSSGGTAVNGLARWSGTAWSAVPNWNAPPVGVLTLDVFDDGSGAGRRLLAMKGNDELVASNGGAWTTIAFTDPYFTFARAPSRTKRCRAAAASLSWATSATCSNQASRCNRRRGSRSCAVVRECRRSAPATGSTTNWASSVRARTTDRMAAAADGAPAASVPEAHDFRLAVHR